MFSVIGYPCVQALVLLSGEIDCTIFSVRYGCACVRSCVMFVGFVTVLVGLCFVSPVYL